MGDHLGQDDEPLDQPVPRHAALVGVEALLAAAEQIRGARTWSLSDAEMVALVEQAAKARAAVEASWLGLVKALDERSEAIPGAPAGHIAQVFLTGRLRFTIGQAKADVEAAHALDPEDGVLPEMGAALAAGEVTRAHADVAVKVARDLPKRLQSKVFNGPDGGQLSGMQVADRFLTAFARENDPRSVRILGEHLLDRLDPDRQDRLDPDAYLRRSAGRAWDSTGMLRFEAKMDGAAGAEFCAVWDILSAPHASGSAEGEDGQQTLLHDDRSTSMRMVDGLSAMARLAKAHLDGRGESATDDPATRDAAALRAVVAVTASAEQVEQMNTPRGENEVPAGLAHLHTGRKGPITRHLLSRLSCDGGLFRVLTAPTGAVLNVGRTTRFATAGQRRALAVRDGGCVRPGCAAPPEICDAHHIVPWSRGGPTDLSNLVLLCPRDHTVVHSGQWTIEMRDGVPWMIPPWSVDPLRRPRRNTTHEAARHAQVLGEQLRLLLDE